jgi:hypothetical protein
MMAPLGCASHPVLLIPIDLAINTLFSPVPASSLRWGCLLSGCWLQGRLRGGCRAVCTLGGHSWGRLNAIAAVHTYPAVMQR